MKRFPETLLIVFILLFSCGFIHGQGHLLFHDDFSLDRQRWTLNGGRSPEINEGKLIISGKDNMQTLCTHEVWLDNGADFRIESRMTVIPGISPEHYGLCWGLSDRGDRYYAFLIRPEGYFAIEANGPEGKKLLTGWTKFRKIEGMGEENHLVIQKSGWKLIFLINGKEVFDMKFPKIYGQAHGFILSGKGRLEIDTYSIYHPPVDIRIAEGTWKMATRVPLDTTINTPDHHETSPVVSRNGRLLYFTRADSSKGLSEGNIWFSEVQGDTMWGEPAELSPLINNNRRNSVAFIYPGGQSLFLNSREALSITYRNRDGEWEKPVREVVPNYASGPDPVSCHLSPDGKVMILSQMGTDSYGDLDLYVSFRENNEWTSPRNLGPEINTSGMEVTPYLSSDEKTLYFSSSGHPGYGSADVYKTTRLSNTWTKWSEPENLGPVVNTREWDGFYTPLNTPRQAYMASRDTLTGIFNIFSVSIPPDLTKEPIVRVYGRVLHSRTQEPLGSEITCNDLSPDSLSSKTQSHPVGGNYNIFLPYGKAYQLFAEKIGFYATTDTLDLRRISRFREIKRDLYLTPIQVGETITLKQLFFKRAKAELLPESYPELDRLVLLMRSLPELKIEIRGHTDNIGYESELQFLSEERARVVREYLTRRGISETRTTSVGFGSRVPVASNENPATRSLNRRVEFQVIGR